MLKFGFILALNSASAQEPVIINDSIFLKVLNEQRKIQIYIPEEYKPGSNAKYGFALCSCDGSKFFINGHEIINNDGLHGNDWYKSYVVLLQKGFYPVRLEYFQSEGNRQLDLIYISPITNETVNVTFNMMYFKLY